MLCWVQPTAAARSIQHLGSGLFPVVRGAAEVRDGDSPSTRSADADGVAAQIGAMGIWAGNTMAAEQTGQSQIAI